MEFLTINKYNLFYFKVTTQTFLRIVYHFLQIVDDQGNKN